MEYRVKVWSAAGVWLVRGWFERGRWYPTPESAGRQSFQTAVSEGLLQPGESCRVEVTDETGALSEYSFTAPL